MEENGKLQGIKKKPWPGLFHIIKSFKGTPAKFRGILAKDGADSIHEERQIRYAPQLSTEAFEFGVE